MRTLISTTLAIIVIALSGCLSAPPNPKAVGVFKNKQGHHLLLTPEGEVYESDGGVAGDKLRFIGIACSEKKNPKTFFITTPSSSQLWWMGATLVFSNDFRSVDVFGYEPRVEPTKPPQDSYERVY